MTVRCANSSTFWKVRATPSAATRCGRSPTRSMSVLASGLYTTRPDCGRYTPEMTLKIDVFPAPFGPMIANSSLRPTSKLTPSMALTPANRSRTSSNRRIGDWAAALR